MKQRNRSNGLRLASSVTEKTLAARSERRMHSVLATLEACQAALACGGNRATTHLVSVAILELRMKLNRIADTELKALCDAMLAEAPAEGSQKPTPPQAQRGLPLLKLVKEPTGLRGTFPASWRPMRSSAAPRAVSRARPQRCRSVDRKNRPASLGPPVPRPAARLCVIAHSRPSVK
jgi:hypothetical protein